MFWALLLVSVALVATIIILLNQQRTYTGLALAFYSLGMLACNLATWQLVEAASSRVWQFGLLLSELSGITAIVSLLASTRNGRSGP